MDKNALFTERGSKIEVQTKGHACTRYRDLAKIKRQGKVRNKGQKIAIPGNSLQKKKAEVI